MPKLVLFDIDGTLVLTGGAGIRAMNRACEEMIGHRDALDGIPVAGRTDWIILHDALRAIGRDLDETLFARLRDSVRRASARRRSQQPGRRREGGDAGHSAAARRARSAARRVPRAAHGNFERSARIKLEHFNLWRYFRAARLATMPRIGMRWCRLRVERARGCGLEAIDARVDLRGRRHAARRRLRARRRRRADRRRHRHVHVRSTPRQSGAEIVFEDLSDTDAVLAAIDAVRLQASWASCRSDAA